MNTSLWTFISDAGIVVKFVMLILIMASLYSWTIIIQRLMVMSKMRREFKHFEASFWSGTDLNALFTNAKQRLSDLFGLEHIFYSGFDAFLRMSQTARAEPKAIMENVTCAMRSAQSKETERLEKHVAFLATIGSVSPYIGLFGTVWGIMTALQSLGTMQQATIAMVAPGISEALIATAIGLFVAIPAHIAYNRFVNTVDVLSNQYSAFQDDFFALLQRQTHASTAHVNA